MTGVFAEIWTFPAIATLMLLAGLGAVAIYALTRWPHAAGVAGAGIVAVLADLAMFLIFTVQSPVLVADAATWHQLATEAAAYLSGHAEDPIAYVEGKEGYIWIIGALYAIAGPAPIVAIFFGVLCHALLVVTVAKSSALLLEEADAPPDVRTHVIVRAAYLAALTPILVWWAPHVLRESLTLLLVSSSVLFALLALVRRRLWPLLLGLGSVVILTTVRSSLGLIVGLAISAALLFIFLGRTQFHLLLRSLLLLAVAISFPLLQSSLSGALDVSEQDVAATTAELATIAASGFPGLSAGSGIAQVLTVTAPRVLFGPFPWEWSLTLVMLLAMLELACWIVIVVLAIRGLSRFKSGDTFDRARWLTPALVVVAAVILLGLMMTVGNYGILARFRPIPAVIILPLSAVGSLRRVRVSSRRVAR